MLWDFLPWLLEEANFRLWWWFCITPHKLFFCMHCITSTEVFACSSKSNRSSVTIPWNCCYTDGSNDTGHRENCCYKYAFLVLNWHCGSSTVYSFGHVLRCLLPRATLIPWWGLLMSWVASKCCSWVFECICLASAWIKKHPPEQELAEFNAAL